MTQDDSTGFLAFAMQRKHSAGRLLEAERWRIVSLRSGHLSVECHVPEAVLNLGGFVFGGFTPTYVDFVAIWTCMTTMEGDLAWLSTVNMRIDYLEPIHPPGFRIDSRVVNVRKRDYLVETQFRGADETLLAFALTNLRKMSDRSLREL